MFWVLCENNCYVNLERIDLIRLQDCKIELLRINQDCAFPEIHLIAKTNAKNVDEFLREIGFHPHSKNSFPIPSCG